MELLTTTNILIGIIISVVILLYIGVSFIDEGEYKTMKEEQEDIKAFAGCCLIFAIIGLVVFLIAWWFGYVSLDRPL
jgi:cell division protein FtsW (lipid II flippase)